MKTLKRILMAAGVAWVIVGMGLFAWYITAVLLHTVGVPVETALWAGSLAAPVASWWTYHADVAG